MRKWSEIRATKGAPPWGIELPRFRTPGQRLNDIQAGDRLRVIRRVVASLDDGVYEVELTVRVDNSKRGLRDRLRDRLRDLRYHSTSALLDRLKWPR